MVGCVKAHKRLHGLHRHLYGWQGAVVRRFGLVHEALFLSRPMCCGRRGPTRHHVQGHCQRALVFMRWRSTAAVRVRNESSCSSTTTTTRGASRASSVRGCCESAGGGKDGREGRTAREFPRKADAEQLFLAGGSRGGAELRQHESLGAAKKAKATQPQKPCRREKRSTTKLGRTATHSNGSISAGAHHSWGRVRRRPRGRGAVASEGPINEAQARHDRMVELQQESAAEAHEETAAARA
jgi:hypothetical protein